MLPTAIRSVIQSKISSQFPIYAPLRIQSIEVYIDHLLPAENRLLIFPIGEFNASEIDAEQYLAPKRDAMQDRHLPKADLMEMYRTVSVGLALSPAGLRTLPQQTPRHPDTFLLA